MKDRQQEMMRELADRMNAVGFEPIGMAAAKEKIQEHLNDNAKPEKDAARKTAEYWKAEHLAGNAIIESLRAELAELRARVAVPDDVAKDAERYRWIRSDMKMLWGDDVLAIIGESGASFDAAIDAAILAADTEGRKDGGAR